MSEKFRFNGFYAPAYTSVPDALIDDLLPHLSHAELKVLLYITRRTFGFKRDSDNISLSQMVNGIVRRDGRRLDHGAALSKSGVTKALASLIEKNIIIPTRRSSADHGDQPTNYRLNLITHPAGEDAPDDGQDDRSESGTRVSTRGHGVSLDVDKGGVSTRGQAVSPPVDTQETVRQETDGTGTGAFRFSSGQPGMVHPQRSTINWTAIARTYGITEGNFGRVFSLVELQQRVLQQAIRNHALYVQRAAEAVRDSLDGILETFLRNAEEDFARRAPYKSRSQAFQGRWRNFLEERRRGATVGKISEWRARATQVGRLQSEEDRHRDLHEENRREFLEDLMMRGYQIPARLARAPLTDIAAWIDSQQPPVAGAADKSLG